MQGLEILQQRLKQYPGEYECHITVVIQAEDLEHFKTTCQVLGGTAIVIELQGAQQSVQPMIAKYIAGQNAYQDICQLYSALEQSYKLTRVKVEAGLGNQGIPQSDIEAQQTPQTQYFEHHVRMVLPRISSQESEQEPLTEHNSLKELGVELKHYHAHMSRNAISTCGDTQLRFATQRFRQLGDANAKKELDKLLKYLSDHKIAVDKIIREYNIFDSNGELDAGWENG